MCVCSQRILQPITEDVKVFETVLQPYNAGALIANKSLFGAIEIPCFFRSPGDVTEVLGYELLERVQDGGTLLKLATKFLLLGYNGYDVSAGDLYDITELTEAANPLLALDTMASGDYTEIGARLAHGFKQARPGTFIVNPKQFSANETKTSAWLHVLSGGTGTYDTGDDAYTMRVRVKYRRYASC